MKLFSLGRVAVVCLSLVGHSAFAQSPALSSADLAIAPLQLGGVHHFYRVNEHVYRSAQPTKEGLQALSKLGIKTVVDLHGDEASNEAKLLQSMGIKYVAIPMPPLAAPSMESVKQALAVLTDPGAWPVLVHCQRGADRTGTVIACYRISQNGWTNQKALEEASQLGMYAFQKAKKQFILDFPAFATATAKPAPVHPTPGN